jgi:hypothetical protein
MEKQWHGKQQGQGKKASSSIYHVVHDRVRDYFQTNFKAWISSITNI